MYHWNFLSSTGPKFVRSVPITLKNAVKAVLPDIHLQVFF